jgi:hypothetical protein
MAWQPEDGQLRQLAGYLKDSLSGHNPVAQKNATSVSIDPCCLWSDLLVRREDRFAEP